MNGVDYLIEYATRVRGYVYIMDLASAHYKVLEYLRNGNNRKKYNAGDGKC